MENPRPTLLQSVLTFAALCGVFATCTGGERVGGAAGDTGLELVQESQTQHFQRLSRRTMEVSGADVMGLTGDDPDDAFAVAPDPGAARVAVRNRAAAEADEAGAEGAEGGDRALNVPDRPITISADPAADSLVPGIRGRVMIQSSGLGGVPVRLETAHGEVLETTSFVGRRDQRGFFAFRSVPPGTHRLVVDLPTRSGVALPDSARDVQVAHTGRPTQVFFAGELRPEAEVRGQVLDREGQPMEGVRVALSGDALEGYPHSLSPTLDSLAWSATTSTDAEGRYSIAAPPGWYHLSIWREDWLHSLAFARYQYRSSNPVLTPGETEVVGFDFREFDQDDCTAAQIEYGDVVKRGADSMHCSEALHPTISRFEIWTFEGRAGEPVEVAVHLDGSSPLYLMGPDSILFAADHGEADSVFRSIRTVLEQTGTHFIVVTHAGPTWKAPDPYDLSLRRLERTPPTEERVRDPAWSGEGAISDEGGASAPSVQRISGTGN